MASINLSQQLSRRVGQTTKNGTRITEGLVSDVMGDENCMLVIQQDNTQQIANAFDTAYAKALEEIGLAAERFAKKACPVDTGRLRNSITHVINMGMEEVFIGTNVPYAPYVEDGTHKMAGKKFLYQAASQHGDFYRRILEKHLKGA